MRESVMAITAQSDCQAAARLGRRAHRAAPACPAACRGRRSPVWAGLPGAIPISSRLRCVIVGTYQLPDLPLALHLVHDLQQRSYIAQNLGSDDKIGRELCIPGRRKLHIFAACFESVCQKADLIGRWNVAHDILDLLAVSGNEVAGLAAANPSRLSPLIVGWSCSRARSLNIHTACTGTRSSSPRRRA